MRLKSPSIVLSLIFLMSACTSVEEREKKQASTSKIEPWTLTFTHLKNGKKTHTEEFAYQTRQECFHAMYQKEVEAKKKPKSSGAGMCTKWFAEGQVQTQDDALKTYK